jgi:hypothetical protein
MIGATLVLAGCGSGGTTTTSTVTTTTTVTNQQTSAKATFCADLKNFSAAVTELQGLDPKTATKADVTSAANSVKAAGNQVESSAKALASASADVTAFHTSVNSLQKSIQSLPSGNTIEQDLTALQPALQTTAGSFKKIFDGAGCPTS